MQKRNIILIVMLSIMLITIIGAASYAYLRTTSAQGNNNTISTITCLELSYLENSGDRIILNDAYPVSDNVGLYQMDNTYSFGIRNNCTVPILAEVNLESLNIENKLDPNYIKIAIITETTVTPSGSILGTRTAKDATIEGATSNNLLNQMLLPGEEHQYSIKLWIDSATTAEQGLNKHYQGKVVAIAKALVPVKKNEVLTNAETGTLLASIRDGSYAFVKPLTVPGRAKSVSYEKEISSTPDDYGTSYYFRGVVENNYVAFAGMCWRIVRITGDGSIKLVLYNYSSTNCAQTGNNLAFARISEGVYQSKFGINNTTNAYIGFMYGTPGSTTYAAEHENLTDSPMLTSLKTWYDNTFSAEQQALLSDTIWCNDKSTSGSGYNTVNTDYNAYNRLKTAASANPTLVCPADKNDGNLSRFTAQDTTKGNGMLKTEQEGGTYKYYKIGLLTSDEVAFAGGIYNSGNSTYYLYKNCSSTDYWWTLSPMRRYTNAAIFNITTSGSINFRTANYNQAVRPSIALIPEIRVTLEGTGDPGTATNPYVVNESYNYNS